MRYKRVNTNKRVKANSPFIIPVLYYIFGVIMLILMTCTFIISPPQDSSDFVGVFGIILVFGGLGILSIVVGYKRRKW